MKLSILGSSGSLGAPGNPASGYLLSGSLEGARPLLLDIGPGVLAAMQATINPADVHVLLSHLHADHCLDFPSLLVWRRYHPTLFAREKCHFLGPKNSPVHLGRLSADDPEGVDDFSDTFIFSAHQAHVPVDLEGYRVTPFPAVHPIEAYSLRVEERATGQVVAYSGDTAWTDELVECARDADLFLCEATWGENCEGKAPDMHICGVEAGRAARLAGAKHLVLIHIPPWVDAHRVVDAARKEYEGPITLGLPGTAVEVTA